MAIVWWTTSYTPTRWTQVPNATVVAASTVLAGGFIASLAAIENAQQPGLPLAAPGWHPGWSTYSGAKGGCGAPSLDATADTSSFQGSGGRHDPPAGRTACGCPARPARCRPSPVRPRGTPPRS